MNKEKLAQLLTHMKRYGTINNEDVPELVKAIEELQASEQLAWVQLDQMDETILAWKLLNEEEL
jgi:hypothetical protein